MFSNIKDSFLKNLKTACKSINNYFTFSNMDDSQKNKFNNLNSLRLFAAILVIYGHMYALLGQPSNHIVGNAVSSIAVKIFFIISGYLLCESWKRDPSILRYSVRRFFRIIPGLVFLILVTAFIVGPIFSTLNVREYFTDPNFRSYFSNMFLYISYTLPGVFYSNIYPVAVNGSLWSLPAEVFMYILLPVVFNIGKLNKSPKNSLMVFSILLIILDLSINILVPNFRLIVYATNLKDVLNLAPYFFMGSLFAFPEIKKFLNIQVAFTAIAALVSFQFPVYLNEPLLLIFLPYCVLSFGLAQRPLFWRIGLKNDYSYGVYLYGFLVQQMLISIFGTQFSVNRYFILCTLATMIFAVISWHLVENKAQTLSKKILQSLK